MGKEFDVIEFETEREETFKRSQSVELEISNAYNYGEGIDYFYVNIGDLEIGQYYRDPWGACWYWKSSVTGDGDNCQTKKTAIANIERAFAGWLA